jgi:hypothetical protein
MNNTPEMIDMATMTPGTQFLRYCTRVHGDVVTTVLRTAEADPDDFFGRPNMLRAWCRREDSGVEGWVPFGPGGKARRAPGEA